LRINWDLINSVTDTDEGQRIEDYVSQLEEWFDDLEAAEEALWDIEDAVEEIKERGEDQYFELENAIKEALVQSYQDEIDKLSEINNSINDTNSALLDAM
jgi:methyl-accepting chemotaxis protein